MLGKLKKYSAQKPLAVFLRDHQPNSTKKLDKVGIILDLDIMDADFDLSNFRKSLHIPYEVFYPIIYSSQESIAEKYTLERFDGKNLGWRGTFVEGSKEELFQKENYALLLNYFTDPILELLILSASVKANLKVGFPMKEKSLNDLELNLEPKEYQLFAEELKKYLPAIKN